MRHIAVRKSMIPGVFTIFNLFFGFLAIVMASQGHFHRAVWLILAAAFFDALDGKLARLFGIPSRFGVEFDSVADLVSFCTAPAVLIYFAYLTGLHPVLGAAISFFPLLMGGVRLARFNIKAAIAREPFFTGLPTTAAAVVISSFVLFNLRIYGSAGDPRVALPLVFMLSFLMVSRVRYQKVPELGTGRRAKVKLALVLLGLGAVAAGKALVLFPAAMGYVSWGISGWLIRHEESEVELEVEEVSTHGDR